MLLLTALLLLAGQRYAFAQNVNTAEFPYLNSWHKYEVATGGGDEYQWDMFNSAADANTNTNPTSLKVRTAISGAVTETIDIYFDAATYPVDAVDGYFLVYSEYSSNSCIARRILPISTVTNSLTITAGADDSGCNSIYNGTIWDNSITDLSVGTYANTVSFTISLNEASGGDFRISDWSISGGFTIVTGASYSFNNTFATMSGTSTHNGTWSISGTEAAFTINVAGLNNEDIDTDEITITLNINGKVTEDVVVTMSLNSTGYASYGTLNPGVYENGTGNKTSTQTIYGVPNTPTISLSP